jgi:hypothetical protein
VFIMATVKTARSNIRATAAGACRTGNGVPATAPVKIIIVAGPSAGATATVPQPSTPAPRKAAKRAPQRKATAPTLVRLPKGKFARAFAMPLCAKLAGGAAHSVKVVQSKIDINAGPAFKVFLRLAGQARGKHVITLYANAAAK